MTDGEIAQRAFDAYADDPNVQVLDVPPFLVTAARYGHWVDARVFVPCSGCGGEGAAGGCAECGGTRRRSTAGRPLVFGTSMDMGDAGRR